MQWKKAFTTALAVLMLTASSWAAVCDVACMVQRSQSGCRVSEAAEGHHLSSMSHAHCAHMKNPETSKIGPTSFIEATSSCTHSMCCQPDSLVDPAKSVQFDRVQWAIAHQVLIAEQGLAPNRFVSEAPPPVIVRSLAPLSVTLRI